MKQTKKAVFSGDIKDAIDKLDLTRIQRNKAYNLVSIYLNYVMIGRYTDCDYNPMPAQFFRTVFSDGRYLNWFQPMVDAKIFLPRLNVKGTKLYFPKHCIHFKLNPKLLTDNLVEIDIEVGENEQTIKMLNEEWDASFVRSDFFGLILNSHKLLKEAKRMVDDISIDNLILDEAIPATNIQKVSNWIDGYIGRSNKATCIELAKKHGANLIQDGSDYFIADVNVYLSDKKKNTLLNYQRSIKKLCEGNIYVNRNDTNNRLDHNLTAMSKKLVKVIKDANDLVEIDLANSQFAILAYIMQQDTDFSPTPDFKLFKSCTAKGNLYQEIASTAGISVSRAKQMMMEIAFSSHNNNTADKKILKGLFPSVVSYIDSFKKWVVKHDSDKAAYNQLSIRLQQFEARLFVDHFYNQLKRDGYFVITKHDSLIVNKQDVDTILKYLNEAVAHIGFDCTFRTDIDKGAKVITMNTEQKKIETPYGKYVKPQVQTEKTFTDEELGIIPMQERLKKDWIWKTRAQIQHEYNEERFKMIEELNKKAV